MQWESYNTAFEEVAISINEMENRINAISTEFPWYVYEVDVGYWQYNFDV